MAMSISRKTLIWTAISACVAALTLAVAFFRPDSAGGSRQSQSGTGNQQAGSDSVNISGNGNVVEFQKGAKNLSIEEAKKFAEKYASIPPSPGEPAAFMVVGAPKHLYIRSSGKVDGHRVGFVYNESIIWADCRATTGWDGDPMDSAPDVWLRIRWNTDKPNSNAGNSEPSGQYQAWAYAGYTVPAGHNGDIPECDGT